MSEWVKARGEMKKEVRQMEKVFSVYDYKDPKHAQKTDGLYTRNLAEDVGKCRDLLFPLIEAAYVDKDFDNAGALEEIMQWLDAFLLELELKLEWSEEAGYKDYMKLIRADVALWENAEKLVGIMKTLNEQVLHGKAGRSVVKKSAQIKQYIIDMLTVFKRRRHAIGG